VFEAEAAGFHARVEVPTGQPLFVGTYSISITDPRGNTQTFRSGRNGTVVNLALADLERDGIPEALVVTRSTAAVSSAEAALFVRGPKGLERRSLPALGPDQVAGYVGHDEYAIADGTLWRSFPIYPTADPGTPPSGGTKRFRYDPKSRAWVAP